MPPVRPAGVAYSDMSPRSGRPSGLHNARVSGSCVIRRLADSRQLPGPRASRVRRGVCLLPRAPSSKHIELLGGSTGPVLLPGADARIEHHHGQHNHPVQDVTQRERRRRRQQRVDQCAGELAEQHLPCPGASLPGEHLVAGHDVPRTPADSRAGERAGRSRLDVPSPSRPAHDNDRPRSRCRRVCSIRTTAGRDRRRDGHQHPDLPGRQVVVGQQHRRRPVQQVDHRRGRRVPTRPPTRPRLGPRSAT